MKKYLLLFALLSGGFFANSQDLKNVILYTTSSQYDKAKPEVDSYLADAKNASKPEGWYYKAYIYNALGRKGIETKPIPEAENLFQGAFAAIKKHAELDPKRTLTNDEKNSTIYNIYYGFNDLGAKAYNNKDYATSYELFKKMEEVHDYVYDNKLYGPGDLKMSAHDTDIVWTLAILAVELKKKDESLAYYKKIVEANLTDEKYINAYDDVIKFYKREKNTELFNKYLEVAKKYYPEDKLYWETQQIDYEIKDLENDALFAKYEELTSKLPDSYMLFYNYAVDIDKFSTAPEAKGKDIKVLKAKIEELLKKAISLKSSVEANVYLANFYYNSYFEIQDVALRITGTKPMEVARKKELTVSYKETLNKAVPYTEAAIKQLTALTEFKSSDKTYLKLAYEIMATVNKVNGDAAKAAEYEKKKTDVDKL